ncbi:MAG: NAD-dependent epimerase/dehydratase family protein, partial [Muribaculaceae bacterium]|nr:NAD-dependent epimerase/dehydratase family protein [Muribaculaceae bacterium]
SDLAARPIPAIKDSHNASEYEISAALASFGIFADHLDLWGSGSPLREFLWSEDMADASIHVLLNVHFDDLRAACPNGEVRNTHINIGSGTELTIAQLAQMIKETVGFGGQIRWDSSKPDGTPRKLCDVSKIHSLGWKHKVELPEGISRLYKWYLEN